MSSAEPHGAPSAPYRRALIVANPIAGRGRARVAASQLHTRLIASGIETDLHLTSRRGDGGERVRTMAGDVDLVVAVGGDGTLGEVMSGLTGRDVSVAQLPLGTANVLAKDARLPRSVDGLIRLILDGSTTLLDTATVNARLSFLCVGIGFDGACVAEVERRRTGPISKFDYVRAGISVVREHRPAALRLEIDGREVAGEFGFVLISNVREYGALFRLSSQSRRDDGRVEVYAVRRANRRGLMRLAWTALLTELPGRAADFWQARSVRVTASEDTPWQIDGDLGGFGSVDYTVDGPTLRLVAPR